MLSTLGLPAVALAQGVDAHGPVLPPVDGAAGAPLTLVSPSAGPRGAWSAGAILELVDRPLVRFEQTGPDDIQEVVLLDDAVSLDLGGTYALHDRVAVGASVPLFLGAGGEAGAGGPALGDLHLWVPLGVVLPDGAGGFALSAVPFLDLPTGPEARFLGDAGAQAGLVGAAGYGAGPVSLTANLGIEAGARSVLPNQVVGGPALLVGGAVGYAASERIGVHLEGRMSASLDAASAVSISPDAADAGRPLELLLTVKGRLPGSTWFAAGAGRGATGGVGAARFRGFVGMGGAYDPSAEPAPTVGPEGYRFTFLDPAGTPVQGAILLVGGREVGRSDADGVLAVDEPRWRKGVEVRAPGYFPVPLGEPEPGATGDLAVTLDWEPRAVPIRITDSEGKPVVAELVVRPVDDPDAEPIVGAPGALSLEPGTWRVEVSAEGFGTQARELEVSAGTRPPTGAEVVLLPAAGEASLVHRITDVDGYPVAGARVLLDGLPVGTTGEGGTIELGALAVGEHRLLVQHESFTRTEEPALAFGPGENVVATTMRRAPGSVKVVVRGPDGRLVPDAVVRLDGPRRLAPMPLGDRGERVTVLGPGSWDLVVSSAAYGFQEREIVVPPDSHELITVEIVLQPQEQGEAELALRIVDPEGKPVDGVSVALDDRTFGATSTGGALRVAGLKVGPRLLTVEGEAFRAFDPLELLLVEGLQEQVVTLDWKAGSVHVLTRSPDAPVDDAVVRFVGPERPPPSPLGPGGEGRFQLASGSWEVVVTSEAHGLATRRLLVPPDSRVLHEVDIVMNPGEGGLAELDLRVANLEGHSVAGAEILLDGTSLGRTTNTGSLELDELSMGRRRLEVRAPLYQPLVRDLRLLEGGQEEELVLDWAAGVARVRVLGAEGPVDDAVVRLLGPTPVPPARVDRHGEQLFQLGPGRWQALVVSESHGIAQRSVEITDADVGLVDVPVEMKPVAAGSAALLVRVVDPDGRPVPGALVTLDRTEIGPTGDGGALLVEGLPPGPATVSLAAEHYGDFQPARVKLDEGSQERIFQLDFLPGTVSVSVRDTAGRPVDAEVSVVGPADVPSFRTGLDGVEPVSLRPGSWQVIASTDSLGPDRTTVEVSAGDEAVAVELVLEPTRVQFTDSAVVIKEKVAFDFDRATLRADSGPVLDEVANTLLSHAGIIRVEVAGHTDNVGKVAYNTELSQRRAEAVVAALVERGVPPEKLRAQGYGTSRPIADNETEEGRATNRRVEFQIVERAEIEEKRTEEGADDAPPAEE